MRPTPITCISHSDSNLLSVEYDLRVTLKLDDNTVDSYLTNSHIFLYGIGLIRYIRTKFYCFRFLCLNLLSFVILFIPFPVSSLAVTGLSLQ
jgi:hypothetical protein